MTRKLSTILAILMIAVLVLTACQPAETTEPAAPTQAPVEPTAAPVEPTAAPVEPTATEAVVEPTATEEVSEPTETAPAISGEGKIICQVTDMGGIDDKSFNATAWKGAEMAADQFGVEAKYLESTQQTDYAKNINAYLEEGCDLIVTVGFLLGDDTKVAAEENPDQPFAIIDYAYDPVIENVRASVYNIDQATFLAGYLAAGMSESGIIGTYGGLQIPSVTAFMDGFYLGVQKYNEVHGTNVQVLGWDPTAQEGLFTGDFNNLDNGKRVTESLLDEGADIIMPVAGPVGGGTLAALDERGTGLMIGVDTDWSSLYSENADVILASATKAMDQWVVDTTELVLTGEFKGETYVGTLENEGVGLVIGSAFTSQVPADLLSEIDDLKASIIAGEIETTPPTE